MNQSAQRTVLLTGSEGFLGQAIQRFAPENILLVATDLNDGVGSADSESKKFKRLDILKANPEDFENVDIVIHNAGLFDLTASRDALMKVNVQGSKRVATAATKAGVSHFIQVSSTSVYGPKHAPIHEFVTNKTPVHHYGASKWLGECESESVCNAAGTLWTAIRPTLIYGPGSRYGMAPFVAALDACAQRGRRPFLPANGPLSHVVHVDDVAQAIWHAIAHQLDGPFNVADDTPTAFGEILAFIATQLNVSYRSLKIPWSLARLVLNRPALIKPVLKWVESSMQRPQDRSPNQTLIPIRLDEDWGYFLSADYVFDTTRLTQTGFAYTYPETNKGLIETIKWYRDHEWL